MKAPDKDQPSGGPAPRRRHLLSRDRGPQAKDHDVYLSLGSNIGDRFRWLRFALRELAAVPQVDILKVSSVYETDPWGLVSQRAFYNAVVRLRTSLTPLQLLRLCQRIEKKAGRERDIRWGPRTLDIDILMYDRLHLETPRLTLPHPRIKERDFVLVPLAEVESGLLLARPGVHRLETRWSEFAGAAGATATAPGKSAAVSNPSRPSGPPDSAAPSGPDAGPDATGNL